MSSKIVMVLTNGFDPDVRVFKEAKYLIELGYEVEVLCWDRRCEYKDKSVENKDGVIIKRFHIKSTPGSGVKQLLPYFKYIWEVKKYLKTLKYEFLHCHDFDGMIVGYVCNLFKKKKMIFDMHELYNKHFKMFVRFFIKKSYKTIHVNNEQLKVLGIAENEKLIYLPNYPEIDNYMPVDKEKKDNNIRVNYVGFLRDYQAIKNLMEVSEHVDDLNIGLYGTGKDYEKLLNENKYQKVKFYGRFDGVNEIAEIYRNTDILYCVYDPSVYNWKTAYPVKLYESILTKTPVIVAQNTTASELVDKNKIGESVEYGSLDSLKFAITQIIENYEEYIANLEKIQTQYSWENMVHNLNAIYMCEE